MTAPPIMSDREFNHFAEFVHTKVGIKMPPAKKTMLTGRLSRRLRATGKKNFKAYFEFLQTPEGKKQELHLMIDAVTTNKTDFFREPTHFDYLHSHALPNIVRRMNSPQKRISLWSAGCSSGEEVYTLAIVLSEFVRLTPDDITFSILGSDISTHVLDKATLGIYSFEDIEPISMDLRKRYLMRSKDRTREEVRIVPELRNKVRFMRLNFMDPEYRTPELMDVIFCRNVLIYFEPPFQEHVIQHLCSRLKPGGYLFLGHSESTHGLNVPVQQIHSTIYQKP